jgi:hypothetical protein
LRPIIMDVASGWLTESGRAIIVASEVMKSACQVQLEVLDCDPVFIKVVRPIFSSSRDVSIAKRERVW